MSHAIQRLHLTVGDVTYPLSPIEHLDALKTAIRDAVRSGSDFVDVALDTGHDLSILITTTSALTISVDTAHMDTGTADGEDTDAWSPPPMGAYDGDAPWDVI